MTNLESIATCAGLFVLGARFGWWVRGKHHELERPAPRVAAHLELLQPEPPAIIELRQRRPEAR